jgi:hypothetical protein
MSIFKKMILTASFVTLFSLTTSVSTLAQTSASQSCSVSPTNHKACTYNGTQNGDNVILSDKETEYTVYAFGGSDNITTSDKKDKIYGGKGGDVIKSFGGRDEIYGEDDNDTIYSGSDRDVVFGGEGDDKIYGEDNNDTLMGNAGNDTLLGSEGNDYLFGGKGIDTMAGGEGDDKIYTDLDGGVAFGQDGKDTIYAVPSNNPNNQGVYPITYVNGGSDTDILVVESRGIKNGDKIFIHNTDTTPDDIIFDSNYTISGNYIVNSDTNQPWRLLVLKTNDNKEVQLWILGQINNDKITSTQVLYVASAPQLPSVPNGRELSNLPPLPTSDEMFNMAKRLESGDLPMDPQLPQIDGGAIANPMDNFEIPTFDVNKIISNIQIPVEQIIS